MKSIYYKIKKILFYWSLIWSVACMIYVLYLLILTFQYNNVLFDLTERNPFIRTIELINIFISVFIQICFLIKKVIFELLDLRDVD